MSNILRLTNALRTKAPSLCSPQENVNILVNETNQITNKK